MQLPPAAIAKILSHLEVDEAVHLNCLPDPWPQLVAEEVHLVAKDNLRAIVFSDADQPECVLLPYHSTHTGIVTYREPVVPDIPKEQFESCFFPRSLAQRWIHCTGDLRTGTLCMDLDMHTFGQITLGHALHRKAGKGLTCSQDGVTVKYTVHFNPTPRGCAGMSWLRVHEVRVPITRLHRGDHMY